MRWGLPAIILAACSLAGCAPLHQTKFAPPDKRIVSVVSLSPGLSEIIANSTSSMLLKGRTAADNYPPSLTAVPIVASVKPDYEAIKKINPDLVMYDSLLYNADDVSKIKALGFQAFVMDANSVADFEKEVYQLGDLVNAQTNFEDYIIRIDSAKNTAMGSKPANPPKVAVIMPGAGGADMICGTKSFIADAVNIAGGKPVGPDGDRFVALSPETLVADNPDVIVFPATDATAAKAAQQILSDPKLASTSAVKNKRVAAMDQDVLLRRGNRVDKLISGLARSFVVVGK